MTKWKNEAEILAAAKLKGKKGMTKWQIAIRVVELITCIHIIAGIWRHWG
jgi:hypothetical protein